MSWSTIDGEMLCSTTSLCSVSAICLNPCRIGTSGLLVRNTRSRALAGNDRASASSCTMMWTSYSLSHSSSASTTTMYDSDSCSFDSGRRTRCCH